MIRIDRRLRVAPPAFAPEIGRKPAPAWDRAGGLRTALEGTPGDWYTGADP